MAKVVFDDLVLWEDGNYVVVNKPAFISSLDDRNDSVNMLSLARGYTADAQLCHRLDKETSGVLVIAKNPEAYRHMSMQFENRTTTKIYWALVDGVHNFDDHLVDRNINKLSNGSVKVDRKGKPAQTYLKTLKAYGNHTLVECKPITGRMHQIRVHLSYCYAPITGDSQYGGRPLYLSTIKKKYNLKKGTEERPLIKRLALHAQKLSFEALDGQKITVEAPHPKDFRVMLEQIEKNS